MSNFEQKREWARERIPNPSHLFRIDWPELGNYDNCHENLTISLGQNYFWLLRCRFVHTLWQLRFDRHRKLKCFSFCMSQVTNALTCCLTVYTVVIRFHDDKKMVLAKLYITNMFKYYFPRDIVSLNSLRYFSNFCRKPIKELVYIGCV